MNKKRKCDNPQCLEKKRRKGKQNVIAERQTKKERGREIQRQRESRTFASSGDG